MKNPAKTCNEDLRAPIIATPEGLQVLQLRTGTKTGRTEKNSPLQLLTQSYYAQNTLVLWGKNEFQVTKERSPGI